MSQQRYFHNPRASQGKDGGIVVENASEYQAANVSVVLRRLGGRYFSLRPQATTNPVLRPSQG